MENSVCQELIGEVYHQNGSLKVVLVQSTSEVNIRIVGSMPTDLDLTNVRKLKAIMTDAEKKLLICYEQRLKAKNGELF